MRPRFQMEPHATHPADFVFAGLALVFWVAVIFGLVVLINHYARHNSVAHNQPVPQDPIDAAKLRYAKGEITKTEFETIKKDLK